MRALIFPRLRPTRCFAASAAQSGVTPLIQRASNTTTRFSSRSSNFHPKNTPETISEGQKSKISWGAMPPDPPSVHPTHTLIAYWNRPFQNSRSATEEHLNLFWKICLQIPLCAYGHFVQNFLHTFMEMLSLDH